MFADGLHLARAAEEQERPQPITVIVIVYISSRPQLVLEAHPCLKQLTTVYTYYAVSDDFPTSGRFSQVLLVGCQDNTTVTIIPTQNIAIPENPQLSDSIYLNIAAGDNHTVTIHELQSLLIWAQYVDLSGTKIVANQPLTVVGGHECAQIPSGYEPSTIPFPYTCIGGRQNVVV